MSELERFLPNVGRVLVQFGSSEKTSGGLYMPDSAVFAGAKTGQVVAAGEPREVEGTKVSIRFYVGNSVLADPLNAVVKLKMDGNEYHMFRMEDIIGLIRPEKE